MQKYRTEDGHIAGRKIESLDNPVVSATLDPETTFRMRSHARETGHSLSSIINDALKLYFARIDRIEAVYAEAVAAQDAYRDYTGTLDVIRGE